MILVPDELQGAELEAGIHLHRVVRKLAQVVWCDRAAEQQEHGHGMPHKGAGIQWGVTVEIAK